MERLDVSRKDYDPKVSRIPELIGKHPGEDAVLLKFRPQAIQIVTPVSATKVSGIVKVEVKIRDGYPEVSNNLKKIIITIDEKRSEFDKPPYVVEFDTSHAHHRLIKISAQAIGKSEESDEDVLSSHYINVLAQNGPFEVSKPLLLFGGVIEPQIDNIDKPWTSDMYQKCYTFSENIISHLMHYGFIPKMLKEMDMLTVLIDPTQLDKGMKEYTPKKLVDVLGREKSPTDGKSYTNMLPECTWIEPSKTRLGTILRGYHAPSLPNDMCDLFEVFAARIISYYPQFVEFGGMPGWRLTQMLFKEVMAKVNADGHNIPWDVYSLLIGKQPSHLKELIKKHIKENGITSIILYDFIPDLSDFEDTKGLWEQVQEAIDLVEKETGNKLQLDIVYTTRDELLGKHPAFVESAFSFTKHELKSCKISDTAKVGLILGEHGYPPGNGEEDVIGLNMEDVRKNIRNLYDKELSRLRPGITEYRLGMNEFNNHPESPQTSSMECMIDFLHRGFDTIIFQPYYFTYETIDLFEHLRHWAFEVKGIDEHELHGGHEILHNYRSDFDFRGTRIIITGSLLGRYEKEPDAPLLKEAYQLFKGGITQSIIKKLESF